MADNQIRFPTLTVEGLGPIASTCPVAIKPMTVFVGPSNTGKSYLALLLHAMSTSIHNVSKRRTTGFSIQDVDHYESHKPEYLSLFNDIYSVHSLSRDTGNIIELHPDDLSTDAHDLIRQFESTLHDDISNALNYSVSTYFQTSDMEELADEIALDGYYNHIYAENTDNREDLMNPNTWSDIWSVALLDNHFGVFSYSNILPFEPLRFPLETWLQVIRNYHLDHDVLSTSNMVQIRYHIEEALLSILRELPRSIYFPAARSGIIASHQLMIANAVSDEYLRDAGNDNRLHRDTIPREFLRHLLSIDSADQSADENAATVANILERAIMGGEIEVRSTQYSPPEFVYSSKGFEIPLTRSSSMVTELAPINLFMRHIVRAGDLLIIEEPEAHLHPSAQQKFAAVLALLVRNGFRVLITTHSHYMVEQISDFVAASNLSPEKRRELLRLGPVLDEQDIYLNEDEVGVYGFDNSSGSTIVKNIPFDENFAYAPPDHIQALTDQFNRNVGIMRAQRNGYSVNGHDGE